MPIGYLPVSNAAWIVKPVLVLVLPIRFTTTSWLVSGLPRQFAVIGQNMRCSILFHLLVPGGKWLIERRRPMWSANRCKATFHSRVRLLLLPPLSARISNSHASG